MKSHGYGTVLEPLLQELVTLESHGVYIAELGRCVKGTVQSVIADNLRAHSLAGFIEGFSGEYFCRFCIGKRLEIQAESVQTGDFALRTKEIHDAHVTSAKENSATFCGVKRGCVLENLSHFLCY